MRRGASGHSVTPRLTRGGLGGSVMERGGGLEPGGGQALQKRAEATCGLQVFLKMTSKERAREVSRFSAQGHSQTQL